MKSVRIRSFSGPYFPTFDLIRERYSVSLRIKSACGKIRTRKTPNTDTFHVVLFIAVIQYFNVNISMILFWYSRTWSYNTNSMIRTNIRCSFIRWLWLILDGRLLFSLEVIFKLEFLAHQCCGNRMVIERFQYCCRLFLKVNF